MCEFWLRVLDLTPFTNHVCVSEHTKKKKKKMEPIIIIWRKGNVL